MRIKRLEIQGFKSFADRTVLNFGDGITGVVGPNGCGKSNIVDALRWAMGEQSAKHLRGDGMSDVIFAGSESRGPMGMAEVTVTFKNDDGALLAPEYRSLSEVSVTRRLFRDGTSEYLVNKQSARLRDVVELFLGTGVGTKSYSIIEQGRIGLVVTSKPEDRRALIEDAAGITKYKARRKQAERRLEAAEQNLVRVRDVVGELHRRMGSLERQAKKAEKYKELRAELKRLELWAGGHRGLELSMLSALERSRQSEAEAAVLAAEGELAEHEASIAALGEEREALGSVVDEKRRRLAEIEQALAVGAKNAEHLARQKSGILERRGEADRELGILRGQLDAARAEHDELLTTGSQLDGASAGEDETLGATEAELEAVQAELRTRKADAERLKQSVFDVTSKSGEQRNQLGFLAKRAVDLDGRRATKDREAAEALAASERAESEARDAGRALDAERASRAAIDASLAETEDQLEALQGEFMDVEAHALSLRGELLDKKARHASLVEIQKNYEGCQEGVRAVMRIAQEDPALAPRLHGLVADVLVAPPELEVAVEAALGDKLQYVIVEDQDAGVASIGKLRASADGRSTFIPLDLREDHVSWAPRRAVSKRPVPSELASMIAEAVAREAVAPAWVELENRLQLHAPGTPEHSEIAAGMAALAAGALSETGARPTPVEVPSLIGEAESLTPKSISDRPPPAEVLELVEALRAQEQARARADSADSGLPYPEPIEIQDPWPDLAAPGVRGKLVDLVRTKGRFDHVARVLLGDVIVVEDLDVARSLWREGGHRKTLVTLAGEVLDPIGVLAGGSSSGVSAGLLAKKRQIEELAGEIGRLEAALAEVAARRSALESEIARLEDVARGLADERHEGDLGIVKLEQDVRRLEADSAASAARKAAVDVERATLERERLAVERERGQAETALVELEQRRAELEAQLGAILGEQGSAQERVEQLANKVTEIKIGIAQQREKREAARRALARAESRLAELSGRIARIEQNVHQSGDEVARIEREIEDASAEKEKLALDAEDRRDALAGLEADLATKIEALRQADEALRSIRRRLDEHRAASTEAQIQLREHAALRQALADQLDERYQLDLESVVYEHHLWPAQTAEDADRIVELKRRVDAMGEINLLAIDEFDEARKRHDFLVKQKDDLDRAIASLKAAIKKINATSETRFMETYALVNEKFQQVFPRLFHGGKASLELTDPSDPLESGVEMLAQPPGKKLQSVGLLSGGEKALTAVALIFSIFLIKPTPFCLLDEVDAPLDDANVGRYNELIRDMSSISQFIVITHNKRTMEVPDRLFGVTMEEAGISKLVSVDIKATEQHLRRVS